MNDEQMKGYIKAIQDIKGQYYVGTAVAKAFLDLEYDSLNKPLEICNEINAHLPKEKEYKATPARVYCSMINSKRQIYDSIDMKFMLKISCEGNPKDIKTFEGETPFHKIASLYAVSDFLHKELFFTKKDIELAEERKFSKKSLPYKVKLMDIAKKSLVHHMTNIFSISENILYSTENYVNSFLDDLKIKKQSTQNFLPIYQKNVEKSIENFYYDEKANTVNKLKAVLINPQKILADLVRDRVDHRFEYRRQVATTFADSTPCRNIDDLKFMAGLGVDRSLEFCKPINHEQLNENDIDIYLKEIIARESKFLTRYLREK